MTLLLQRESLYINRILVDENLGEQRIKSLKNSTLIINSTGIGSFELRTADPQKRSGAKSRLRAIKQKKIQIFPLSLDLDVKFTRMKLA